MPCNGPRGNPLFRQRAAETVGWLAREMTTPEGAFSASLDADSEGEEGKFYVWSQGRNRRGARRATMRTFCAALRRQPTTAISRATIFSIASMAYRAATKTRRELGSCCARSCLTLRGKRVRPGLDDKVLADWNGLMIAALANAGGDARRAGLDRDGGARLRLHRAQHDRDGDRLGHSWRDGQLLFPGLASDFANMIRAALALHEATGERRYLDQALAWQRALDAHYANPDNGGYFLTADDAEGLVVRPASTTRRRHAQSQRHRGAKSRAARGADRRRRNGAPRPTGCSTACCRRRDRQHVRPCGAAQRARPAAARRRDRRHRPGPRRASPRRR